MDSEPINLIRSALSLRHGADDRICVSVAKPGVNRKPIHVMERFVDGIDAAAELITSNLDNPDILAFWTNLQKLKPGTDRRTKDNVERYTHIFIDHPTAGRRRTLRVKRSTPRMKKKRRCWMPAGRWWRCLSPASVRDHRRLRERIPHVMADRPDGASDRQAALRRGARHPQGEVRVPRSQHGDRRIPRRRDPSGHGVGKLEQEIPAH